MKEQERKFKLKELPEGLKGIKIQQGYLFLDVKKHLRVRVIDNEKAYLTYKTFHSSTLRTEYEYEIPLTDAIEMLESTKIKLEKTRYKTEFEGNVVDIDIFSDGTRVVEIEYENELTSIPDYCGEEVTGELKYSNIFQAGDFLTKSLYERYMHPDKLFSTPTP